MTIMPSDSTKRGDGLRHEARALSAGDIFWLAVMLVGIAVTCVQLYVWTRGWQARGDFAGGGLLVASLAAVFLFASRYARHLRVLILAAREQGTPWAYREDWSQGLIASTSKRRLSLHVALCLGVATIGAALIVFGLRDDRDGWFGVVGAGLLFLLVGAAATWKASLVLLSYRRFGGSLLRLASVPAPVGGTLAGVIHANNAVQAAGRCELGLTCEQTVGTGKEQSVVNRWSTTRTSTRWLRSDREGCVAIPVAIDLPIDVPETSADARVVWKLTATARLRGLDYRAEFEVPVLAVEGEPPKIGANDLFEPTCEPPLESVLARQRLVMSRDPAGKVCFHAPPARHRLRAAACALPVVVFVALLWYLVEGFQVRLDFMRSGIALMLALGTINALPVVFHALLVGSDLCVHADYWRVRYGVVGLRGRPTDVSPREIESIDLRQNAAKFSTCGAAGANIVATMTNGSTVTLVHAVAEGNTQVRLLGELRRFHSQAQAQVIT